MEIDKVSLIIGIVFFVVIFGTFGFLIWSGKNRTDKVKKTLSDLVKFHKLTLSKEEVWNDRALGLDAVWKKVIFVDHGAEPKGKLISLVGCVSVNKEVKQGTFIKLRLTYSRRQEVLTLFTVDKDDPVEFGFHEVLAERWTQTLGQVLSNKTKKTPKAA